MSVKIALETFLPNLKPWVVALGDEWPGNMIKPQFATWEVLHILSLILLGGTAILMNLRLLGLGLNEEPPSEIWRNLRRWQDAGVVGIIVTGILIGSANAERLYASTAFVVKLLCLAAGVILTYGASRPVARDDGVVGNGPRVFLALGLAIWLVGLWVFASSVQINAGLVHILSAAALIMLIALRRWPRWVAFFTLFAGLAGQFIVTNYMFSPDDLPHLDPINLAFSAAFVLWILGAGLVLALQHRRKPKVSPLASGIGYVSILVWVTAAAAGRWIAFA